MFIHPNFNLNVCSYFVRLNMMYSGLILDLYLVRLSLSMQFPQFPKKVFSLELVKSDICLGGAWKQDRFVFGENYFRKKEERPKSEAPK